MINGQVHCGLYHFLIMFDEQCVGQWETSDDMKSQSGLGEG